MSVCITIDFGLFPEVAELMPLAIPFAPPGRAAADPSVRGSRFDRLAERAPEHYRLVPEAEAELAVLPVPWAAVRGNGRRVAEVVAYARRVAPIPVLLYDVSDLEDELPVPGAIVLRTSTRRSRPRAYEIVLPGFSEDMLARHAPDALSRSPGKLPVVSFCGIAEPLASSLRLSLKRRVLALADALGRPAGNYGSQVRRQAMRILAKSPRVATSFQVNDAFVGGAGRDAAKIAAVRKPYVQSIVDSDYVLAIRGAGNYSFRFFETLSLGRTPVVIDTDSRFPFDDQFDPRRVSVWVERGDMARLPDAIADHFAKTRSDYPALLSDRRAAWEKWYSAEGYFTELAEKLKRDGPARRPRRTSAATR